MTFLVQEVLETQISLVHVVSHFRCCLLARASGDVGSAVESFQTGKESTGADVDEVWIMTEVGGRGQLGQALDDGIRGRRKSTCVRVVLSVGCIDEGHGACE